mgnify:CR=1 FL=1
MSTTAEKNEEFLSRISGIVRALAREKDVNRVLALQDAKREFETITIRIDPVDLEVLKILASRCGIEPDGLAGSLFRQALRRSENAYCRIVGWP